MWKESYRIGIDLIDRQHEELFRATDTLVRAIEANADKQTFRQTITFLKDYTVRHFHDEEAYQASIHYSGMEDHKKAHRKFTGIILDYERRLVASDFDIRIVKDLAGTLTAWLIYHVADADQRIAKGDTGAGLTLAQSFLNIFSDSALDVMEKMAGFSANDIEEQFVSNKRVQGDIFVEIGLIGDLKGRIIFGFSKELAFKLIEIMTFVEPAEIDELVCSALAELSNITCGNAATALTEHGKVCDIKTPVVTAEPPCGLIDGMVLQTNVGGLEIVVQMEV
ncbi:bacteriohemerythrin [Anaerotruncus colihominis]|uniref:bacteriohemerythrin n=1 Tax=Anaerotruncus colihominis TaxID=169435 RepID=UPI0004B425B0|nr:bacteriohemerythrin [Anaerotruncus colihominis]UOX65121.1 bacteriohemerythrin [Anaerotruncus colihominis]